ncbi:GNAT family N-acetyltransferase [Ectobacillus ponti]|uniref:GNAT family N-acetyltransferase n=1 Tax=Ectobacillus ponti TaxID=2961894 RepID=A0AA41XD61_9BACI|nr:GNAT family N-acetyltransferase [Ectobacillus ponti]MCP8970688.1 GNAT family N-acetyltransferase [Ectobacillus ponti]
MKINIRRAAEELPLGLLLEADPSERLVRTYTRRGQCFVAEAEGDIAGVYVLLPTRPDTVELVNVAVAAHLRGKGIGRQLVLHAVQQAARQGYRTIEVGTGNSSIGQLALYQKCGFRIVGVDRDFFIKHYEEAIFENGIPCRDMLRLSQDLGGVR